MGTTLLCKKTIDEILLKNKLTNIGKASIREIKKLINDVEDTTGEKFIRMEMGIPGLPACRIGVEAEIEALNNGVAAIYPDVYGIDALKNEISKFVKNFMNLEVSPTSCLPTVGSMQGGYAAFLTISRAQKGKDTTLFIDPGFAVHKQQHKLMQIPFESFDVYNYRGNKLKEKLESYLQKGNISSIFYSNPNNPSWICFTEKELQVIGELANKYDIVVMEDLAYFGMDFRNDISIPGQAPYQPSVAKYTENYLLFISSSKAFSYAGQRIGMMVISDKLYNREFENFKNYYSNTSFGHTMIFGTLYPLSSGTAHSAQYGLAAILKAVNDGTYNFIEELKIYGEKAKKMKKIFLKNGFHLVYDMDEDKELSDGFYFTVNYKDITGDKLLHELIYFGISAISLGITGSECEGIRACVSLVAMDELPVLEKRLEMFNTYMQNK